MALSIQNNTPIFIMTGIAEISKSGTENELTTLMVLTINAKHLKELQITKAEVLSEHTHVPSWTGKEELQSRVWHLYGIYFQDGWSLKTVEGEE